MQFSGKSHFHQANSSYWDDWEFWYDYFDYEDFNSSDVLTQDLTQAVHRCHVKSRHYDWLALKLFILATALPANAALLWTLARRWVTMTASELLSLNLSIMNILYCLCLPLDVYVSSHHSPETAHFTREALFSLNIFGCPLLLSFMCVERCVAVVWPIAFMLLEDRKHRVAMSAAAWTLTGSVALLRFWFHQSVVVLSICVFISLLFLLMLLCLLAIVAVLCRPAPGDGSGTSTPLKKKALQNILVVMVPSVVAYSPLVAVVPFLSLVIGPRFISPAQCRVLHVLLLFPNFGLFIGPAFYLSRLSQVSCRRTEQQASISRTE